MKGELFEFYKNALIGKVSGDKLCRDYQREWQNCGEDKEKLVSLSLRQQSIPFFAVACYTGNGLTKEFIVDRFADYINGSVMLNCDGVIGDNDYRYVLYVDYSCDTFLTKTFDVGHFMWCEDIALRVKETKCPTIYLSNKTNMCLDAEGYNDIRVYLFDESTIDLHEIPCTCSVTIYKYSEENTITIGDYCLSKKINIHKKSIRL
jgi:hypothetical protein